MSIGKKWDEKFEGEAYFYGKEANKFLADNFSLLAPESTIMFLGEGEGRSACAAAKAGFRVAALDASEVGIAKTKALADEMGVKVETIFADLENYQFTQAYDAIFSSFLHLMEPLRTQAFQAAITSLKVGGYFVAEFFAKSQMPRSSGGPKMQELLYSVEEFEAILKPLHVKVLLLDEVEDHLDEGSGHQGLASLIRVIVQKM